MLAACTARPPGSEDDVELSDSETIRLRVWDESAVSAYRESFDAFNATRPGVFVDIEYVPLVEYREQAAEDIASGEMADIYWATPEMVTQSWHADQLLDVSSALGTDHSEWEPAVIEAFSHDGTLWGVPQLWDTSVLYVNAEAAETAEVDLTSLHWMPETAESDATDEEDEETAEPTDDASEETGDETEDEAEEDDVPEEVALEDTFLPAATALTVDSDGRDAEDPDFDSGDVARYGTAAWSEDPSGYAPALAQNGLSFFTDGRILLSSQAGDETFTYLRDLVLTYGVAPPADSGATPMESFATGEVAMFQGGATHLRDIDREADFRWQVERGPTGPAGAVSPIFPVATVGYADTANEQTTIDVLRWLGSSAGQTALAGHGVGFPAAIAAQDVVVDHWRQRGVDVTPFLDAVRGQTVLGPDPVVQAEGLTAVSSALSDLFDGRLDVLEALERADAAAAAAAED